MAFPATAGTYPTKDEAADYLVEYAHRFDLPVLLNCAVRRLTRLKGGFAVETSQGRLLARQVVVATGPWQKPLVPALSRGLAHTVVQLHSSAYRNATDLPPGRVVVVGAGNSGRQTPWSSPPATTSRSRWGPKHSSCRSESWAATSSGG